MLASLCGLGDDGQWSHVWRPEPATGRGV